jgi:hypothetical protein
MPSNNPQVSIRLTPNEYQYLQTMAEKNFVTLPQFVKILVKRAIAEDKEKQVVTSQPPSKPKAKANGNGKGRGKREQSQTAPTD